MKSVVTLSRKAKVGFELLQYCDHVLDLLFQFKLLFRVGLLALVLVCASFSVYFPSDLFQGLQYFGSSTASHRELVANCPGAAEPAGLSVLYALGVAYMFLSLAILADDFFVPALVVLSEKMKLSPDVAGATLMAAGGSSPELFTSAVGTFLRSDVGFGAIVSVSVGLQC